MGGQRHEAGLVGSDAHDDLTGTDPQSESNPARSRFVSFASETSAAETGTGQLPLLDETSGALDILYYGPAHFGMPPQALTVDVDTGSADLWVPSGCGKCYGHRFEASRSSTFHSNNQEFSITYVCHYLYPTRVGRFLTWFFPFSLLPPHSVCSLLDKFFFFNL